MYRHALPPGFVLKSQKKEMEAAEKANEISLEEFLETARHQLGPNLTPVTKETFAEWKKRRMDKKQAEEEALENKKKTQAAANKMLGLSGREMFTLNPTFLETDDDDGPGDEFDMTTYFKNWEQDRQSENGGSDDGEEGGQANGREENEVAEATSKLQDVEVTS